MKRKRSLLSILLSIVMMIGLLSANTITAYAAAPESKAAFNKANAGYFTIEICCNLSFDMQGHGTQVEAQTVVAGTKAEKPDDPSEEGYTFGGWYKEPACSNAWNFNTDTVDVDTTIYAKWTANIIITAGSATKTYDGTALTASNFSYTQGVLKAGDVLEAEVEGTITDAGTAANEIKTYKVMRNSEDVTSEYQFGTPVDGTLTVEKKNVTLTSASASKVYDGTPLTDDNVTAEGFVGDEGADYYVTGSQTEVGTSKNTFEYTLKSNTKAGNYNITMVEGNLTVTSDEPETKFTVTFDLGGKGDDFTREVASGSNARRPKNPTYRGWTFKGWFADAAKTIKWIFNGEEGAEDFAITEDTTIYAKWEKTPKYVESGSGYEAKPAKTGTWNDPVTDGTWTQGSDGKWTYKTNAMFKNTWGYILNPYAADETNRYGWFRFDANGKMMTGWVQIDGMWYYLNEDSSRGCLGMCLINTTTPDGYKVDENGAWIG